MNIRYTLTSENIQDEQCKLSGFCKVRLYVGGWLSAASLLPNEIVLEHGQWSSEEYIGHIGHGFIPVYENAQMSWFGTNDYHAGYHNPSNAKFDKHIIGFLKEKRPYYWEDYVCVQ